MLYLDHAATTRLHPAVREAMLPWLGPEFGNPSSVHSAGQRAANALEDARRRIAAVLGRRPREIIFTSGGTESINLAIKGLVLPQLAAGRRHLITGAIEHEAVLASADYLNRFHGVAVQSLKPDSQGVFSADLIADSVRQDTALVSIAHANNEVGTVQDIAALAQAAHTRGAIFHTDAVQSLGWLNLAGLEVDALSIAGHKIGGPAGVGVLAVRSRLALEPLIHGGGQEHGRRSGTENVAAAIGLAVAMEVAEHGRVEAAGIITRQRDEFIAQVLHMIPQASLTGHPHNRLPGNASFVIAGTSGESVLIELERRGVISSSGSACAAGHDEPSHVLLALGVRPELAQTALRFTLPHNWHTNPRGPEMLAGTAEALAASVAAVNPNRT